MSCLSSCHYTTLASLTNNTTSSSSSSQNPPKPATSVPKTKPRRIPSKKNQQNMQHLPMQHHKSQHQKQLAIMEIERAIGGGTFRDTEPSPRDLKEKKTVFNGILPDFSGIFEGPVEKQLRETGEWFSTHTEERIRSSRKGILLSVIKWILPIWTLSLLVASGAIKLPFSVKFIDDLIM